MISKNWFDDEWFNQNSNGPYIHYLNCICAFSDKLLFSFIFFLILGPFFLHQFIYYVSSHLLLFFSRDRYSFPFNYFELTFLLYRQFEKCVIDLSRIVRSLESLRSVLCLSIVNLSHGEMRVLSRSKSCTLIESSCVETNEANCYGLQFSHFTYLKDFEC